MRLQIFRLPNAEKRAIIHRTMSASIPIKQIAGDLLLFFYDYQRKNGFPPKSVVRFGGVFEGEIILRESGDLESRLLEISRGSSADAYNALRYLEEKSFLSFKESSDTGGDLFHGFRVTAYGVDIIEGIERGTEEKNNFHVTFNIKLADNVSIDSLIKAELGGLLKGFLT